MSGGIVSHLSDALRCAVQPPERLLVLVGINDILRVGTRKFSGPTVHELKNFLSFIGHTLNRTGLLQTSSLRSQR